MAGRFFLSLICMVATLQGYCGGLVSYIPQNSQSELSEASLAKSADRNCNQQAACIAQPEVQACPKSCTKLQPSVELKLGYFFFASSTMNKIYDAGGFDLQLSATYPLCKVLAAYGSVEYAEREGETVTLKQSTSIYLIPVSVGLKPIIAITPQVEWYCAIGPRYFYIHQHNQSAYVPKNQGKSGIGFFVNTGFNFHQTEHFFLDLFGEYSYEKIHFSSERAGVYGKNRQVGGFAFGLGLGYAF